MRLESATQNGFVRVKAGQSGKAVQMNKRPERKRVEMEDDRSVSASFGVTQSVNMYWTYISWHWSVAVWGIESTSVFDRVMRHSLGPDS